VTKGTWLTSPSRKLKGPAASTSGNMGTLPLQMFFFFRGGDGDVTREEGKESESPGSG